VAIENKLLCTSLIMNYALVLFAMSLCVRQTTQLCYFLSTKLFYVIYVLVILFWLF
jgi:hypothetical protein